MRAKFLFLAGIFMATGGSTAAMTVPGQNHLANPLQYPGAPRPVSDDREPPYAMNYAEEAVRTLGFKNSHMDVFSTHPPPSSCMPSISGGPGGDGAVPRFRWRPGQRAPKTR